jgi:hypothetical protein
MAKPANGFQFVFDSGKLGQVCSNSTKVVISCFLVEEVTNDGRKVGSLQVWADGVGGPKKKKLEVAGPGGVPGCPIPPCDGN